MHSTNILYVLGTVLVAEGAVVSKMGSCLTEGYFYRGIMQCTRRKYLQRVTVTWESGNGGCWYWVVKEGLFEQKTFELRRCQLLEGRAFHGERNSKCKGLSGLLFWGISGMSWKWERGLSLSGPWKSAFRVWILFWAPRGTFKVAFLSPQLPPLSEDTIIFCLQPVSLLVVSSLLCPINSRNDLTNKSTSWILQLNTPLWLLKTL